MTSPLQIYSGYTDDDVALLQSFIVQKATLEQDSLVDGFSHKTLFASVPFCKNYDLERLTLPVPDDGIHAETLEYVAVCDSVRRAGEHYCIAELGAGWGPWISLGGVLARNKGVKTIHIIGIEPHPERFKIMKNQLSANELRPTTDQNITVLDSINCKLICGAASSKHKTLWFPNIDVNDMGVAASARNNSSDYRGLDIQNIPVQGFTLDEILGNLEVDMLHVDIQGAEFDVIKAGLRFINKHVKGMMIATHSRVIEGELIQLLYKNGWYLHREKPCRVEWKKSPTSIEAMTQIDGCQYWRRHT